MTSLISLHCGFPLEVDLGSSLLFTISELRPLRHQKASTAFNTARRVPGGGGVGCGFGGAGWWDSLPDGAGVVIPPWLEVHLMIDDHANGHTPSGRTSAAVVRRNDKPDKQSTVCGSVTVFVLLSTIQCFNKTCVTE